MAGAAQLGLAVLARAAHAMEVVVLEVAARAVLDHVVDGQAEPGPVGRRRRIAQRVADVAGHALADQGVAGRLAGERDVAAIAGRIVAGVGQGGQVDRRVGGVGVRRRLPLVEHLLVALAAAAGAVDEHLAGGGVAPAAGVDRLRRDRDHLVAGLGAGRGRRRLARRERGHRRDHL
ncbi:MAG TPA: hypothetical protein VM734_08290 [Kofleriaceae bacterium]|nr:hypothetical protein [Kofleriaceae bacterium]